MLIELHVLQNHAPSNLNRDDTGSPKEAFFGGYRRARISSQCLKRSIRKSVLFRDELGDEVAFRTKRLAAQVEEVLSRELGCDPETARLIASRAGALGSAEKQDKEADDAARADAEEPDAPEPKKVASRGKRPKAAKTQGAEGGLPETKQLIFLGRAEVRAVALALKTLHDEKKDEYAKLKAADLEKEIARELKQTAGDRTAVPVEIALFGRMTTSDAFEDVAASLQVAHALSTNKLDHEFDYYTAVDDLKDAHAGDDAGAGMVGDVEFNSSCYYKYFSLDWDAFVRMVRDEELALKALGALIQAVALTTPTGKQNSFAAHNPPDLVLVECKAKKIPLSYANAFVKPAAPGGPRDLVEDSMVKLVDYIAAIDKAYAVKSDRFVLATRNPERAGKEGGLLKGLRAKDAETIDELIAGIAATCGSSRSPERV